MTEYDLGKVVGDDGADGNGIASISKTGTSGLVDTYTITYDDGDSDTFTVTNGADGQTGATGNGIASVTKTGTSGLVDTYTILFTNGNSTTFTVTNGSDASVTIVTNFSGTTSDSKVPSEKLTKTELDKKISISSTTGLIKNDGTIDTTSYSTFSGSYSDLSNKPSIPSSSSDLSDGSDLVKKSNTSGLLKNDGSVDTNSYLTSSSLSNYVQKSNTSGLLKNDGTVDTTSYSTFSGSYSDLSNKPSIPSASSDLSDGSDLVKKSNTTGLLKNDGSVMSSGTGSSNWAVGNHTHSAYVNPTKVTSWSSTPSDSNVASEKLIKDSLDDKISKSSTSGLVKNDGTIDTTTYLSSLPSHNHDDRYYTESEVDTALNGKQATLVSGTNIKTINSQSILGSGNLVIQGGGGGTGGSYINDYYWDSTNKQIVLDYDNGVLPPQIVTSWSATLSDDNVASEKLTKNSLDDKISKSSTTGLVKNDGSIDTNTYLTSSAISGMLTTSDVVDNLTSTSATAPLSAKQGKALNDLIGQAITYINQ